MNFHVQPYFIVKMQEELAKYASRKKLVLSPRLPGGASRKAQRHTPRPRPA
jgi:hypothetical protein